MILRSSPFIMDRRSSSLGRFQLVAFSAYLLLTSFQSFVPTAYATVTVTAATGGEAISSSTAANGGTGEYTELTGPSIVEQNSGDIGTGTIVFNAPAGFEFDDGGAPPTVLLTAESNTNPSRQINNAVDGTAMAITSRSTSHITFTVFEASEPGAHDRLTWQGIRVRPVNVTSVSGNITKTGTSTLDNVPPGTTFGFLNEIGPVPAPCYYDTDFNGFFGVFGMTGGSTVFDVYPDSPDNHLDGLDFAALGNDYCGSRVSNLDLTQMGCMQELDELAFQTVFGQSGPSLFDLDNDLDIDEDDSVAFDALLCATDSEALLKSSENSSSSSSNDGQVTICHNGNTQQVNENAVQAHLNHGDTLGACGSSSSAPSSTSSSSASTVSSSVSSVSSSDSSSENQVTICHNGNTQDVNENAVDAHVNHGDTLGACGSSSTSSSIASSSESSVSSSSESSSSEAPSSSSSVSSNENQVTICHNGNMQDVNQSAVDAHLDHGDTLGECGSSSSTSTSAGSSSSTPSSSSSSSDTSSTSSSSVSSSSSSVCFIEMCLPGEEVCFPMPGVCSSSSSSNENQVTICHDGENLTVNESAVDAHLDHEDTLGACDGSSSSSNSSDEGASSSSTAGSSSAPNLGQFVIGNSGDGGPGGYHGHRTDTARAIAKFLAKKSNLTAGIAPGAFGGTNDAPLSPELLNYLCSQQRLGFQYVVSYLPYYSELLSEVTGLDPDFIAEFLIDESNCDSLNSALLPKAVAVQESIEIPTDANGFIMPTNKFWYICFVTHGEFARTAEEYKKISALQTEKNREGEIRSCSSYYSSGGIGEIWTMPEDDSLPTFTFEFDRATKTYKLPEGMKLQELKKVVQK